VLRPFAVVAFAPISLLSLILLTGCGGSSGIHTFQLTVAAPPAGAGTVTSSPAGIRCPTACSATFAENTQVTLTATPGTNFSFGGWSGACSGDGACIVKMSGAESVTANFASSTGGGGMGEVFVYAQRRFRGPPILYPAPQISWFLPVPRANALRAKRGRLQFRRLACSLP